jgi:hypothetical protein
MHCYVFTRVGVAFNSHGFAMHLDDLTDFVGGFGDECEFHGEFSNYGLQKKCIKAMQHKGAQCQADKHGGEYVEGGFAGHGVISSVCG